MWLALRQQQNASHRLDSSQEGRKATLSALYAFVSALNLAKVTCGIPPVQAIFSSVSALIATILVRFSLLWGEKLLTHIV